MEEFDEFICSDWQKKSLFKLNGEIYCYAIRLLESEMFLNKKKLLINDQL